MKAWHRFQQRWLRTRRQQTSTNGSPISFCHKPIQGIQLGPSSFSGFGLLVAGCQLLLSRIHRRCCFALMLLLKLSSLAFGSLINSNGLHLRQISLGSEKKNERYDYHCSQYSCSLQATMITVLHSMQAKLALLYCTIRIAIFIR